MNEWKKVKLGELSINIQTGPFGSQLHQSDYSDEGIPVIMPKDILNGSISDSSIARVEKQIAEKLFRHQVDLDDIIYPRRGDISKCAIIQSHQRSWLCGTGCLKVSIDGTKANPLFIYYQLQTSQKTGWLEKHAVGATMLNLNTGIIGDVPIDLPHAVTQQKIANILSHYDKLIENYQKQIKLLEEAAQRIYKEWFVDFRFPGHKSVRVVDGVPEGWEKKRVGEFVEKISRTKQIPSSDILEKGEIPVVDQSRIFIAGYTNDVESLVKCNHPIIVFGDHTRILKYIQFPFAKGADGTQLILSNNLNRMPQSLFYLSLLNIDLSNYSYARHFKYLKAENILIPDRFVAKDFDNLVSIYLYKIQNCRNIIVRLTEARDRLLPKLMSGEIQV